ncbi:hypothetical protein CcaverHIS002_0505470 [Cutaneotrichosporon cavernicola]|uniref:Superoxide dismutase n=1 Tax=Cutaneotrichosporon cavernicola TaxID=279322 RepID=A0AA48QX32_9TREE|nr:uncharacterized protein CcaverHIS019_0505990 [Cutaneotrichosporon cavernicola]BEI85146.1 hypothetical protein CcaverHIS002_0505470 [Cutaneotrichosporon cavernicola]BEI92971.1 hypothetical protein CcaverHIS019_0505990 [Cutaneotrichosporon cavernicola]BEJ00747.1 hypothetical protein CcaverHIS631_0506040 [Cutaneotrichosporon cavernicola]BEJ08513.1 hypothetical protein CcaverHIS641_0506070 [Cutaneotrichosporon cavernicola]
MVALLRSVPRAAAPARRAFAVAAVRSKHTLPDLPYAYDALEPSISKTIMTLHHDKHHATYVNGLNAAEEKLAGLQASQDVKGQIALQAALKFNGGGHINHSLFWNNLAPTGSAETQVPTSGVLADQVKKDFGSFDKLIEEVNAKTAGIQGSGWGWLGYNPSSKVLEVVTTANQDPLLTHVPIIGIDIWEHAFYLDYQNVKPEYLKNIWKVVNWAEAEKRLAAAL